MGKVLLQLLDAFGDGTLVHALQVPPERGPPAREPRRALDLPHDGVDVLAQEQFTLPGQEFPALQQPVLQRHKPLHLRRRGAVLPRHPAELRPVVPDPAQELPARVLAPVEQPPARGDGPDAEQAGEDVMRFEGREGPDSREGGERGHPYHQPPREVLFPYDQTTHAGSPPSLRPGALPPPPSGRLRSSRVHAGPSGPPSSPAPARRRAA